MPESDPDAPGRKRTHGDSPSVLDRLFPLIYDDLKSFAQHRLHRAGTGDDMDADGLVHEVYLALADQKRAKYKNQSHLFSIAVTVMRRVLADHFRHQGRQRRGGGAHRVRLHPDIEAVGAGDISPIEFEEILQRLEQRDSRQAMFVKLRFMGGLTLAETAEVMGVSLATAKRDWAAAREMLQRELEAGDGE